MGVFKNGVGRPSNETIKKRNIFKGICVVFGLIIIVLVGYILNDKKIININSKDDKKTVDKKTDKETTKESEKKEVNIEEARKILENYVYKGYHAFIYLTDEYSDDFKVMLAISKTKAVPNNYSCKELFGNDIKLVDDKEIFGDDIKHTENKHYFLIESNDKNENTDHNLCFDGNAEFYNLQDVKIEYKKLFGNISMKQDLVEMRVFDLPIIYGYSKLKKGYVELSCICGGIETDEINYIYDSYEKDNKLHIIFSYYLYTVDGLVSTLTDANKNTIKVNFDSKGNMLESTKDIFEKNKDSVAKFDFILNKDSNGNYIFDKIEKIK